MGMVSLFYAKTSDVLQGSLNIMTEGGCRHCIIMGRRDSWYCRTKGMR